MDESRILFRSERLIDNELAFLSNTFESNQVHEAETLCGKGFKIFYLNTTNLDFALWHQNLATKIFLKFFV
jgi:hypothetical protein